MEKYYKLLGLSSAATFEVVENKYTQLLKEYDPEQHPDELKDFFTSEKEKIDEAFKQISKSILNKNNIESSEDENIIIDKEDVRDYSESEDFTRDEFLENKRDVSFNDSTIIKNENVFFRNFLLLTIAVGVWGLFLQNMGLFVPSDDFTQKVRVVNIVDTEVQGSIRVNGTVSVDNTVDINISKVNGYNTKSYKEGHLGVSTR